MHILVLRWETKIRHSLVTVYVSYVLKNCVSGHKERNNIFILECQRYGQSQDHSDDVQGDIYIKVILYPNLQSAICPVFHGPGIPVPSPPDNLDDVCEELETL
ncbi:hypothetical protein PR048_008134 [Dryococelus australis]|uniref:Uncharacterized protein n=1 Tax=Dryococelus australis TaxID=614101 RepID=A0ABQ9HW81_9NEOP|nr:hypothetical protein PR048_008134 [Dryococelus australis]